MSFPPFHITTSNKIDILFILSWKKHYVNKINNFDYKKLFPILPGYIVDICHIYQSLHLPIF